MVYLLRTVSTEIRLALDTAQLSTSGQGRSPAFLCQVQPELVSSRSCISGARGTALHRHLQVAWRWSSPWPLPTQMEQVKSVMRTCLLPSICICWSRQNLSINKAAENEDPPRPQHLPVWGYGTQSMTDLPQGAGSPGSLFCRERQPSLLHSTG